jgi:hypothetical protein
MEPSGPQDEMERRRIMTCTSSLWPDRHHLEPLRPPPASGERRQAVPGLLPRSLPKRIRLVRETLVILVGALLYFFVRGLMETQVALAVANAEALIALEQRMRLFHEPWLQDQIIASDGMVAFANRIYIFGH